MALQVHRAELPVRRGQNMDGSVSGQSLCLREPLGQPGPLFPPPTFQAQGAGQKGQGIKPTWEQLHGVSPTPRSPAYFLCLFSHTWEGRGSWGKHCAQVSAHLSHACPWAPSHPEPGE